MILALFLSVFLIAACGLIYELIAGTLASYLLGDSVFQFSTIIGCYLFAMGIGSYLSRFLHRGLVARFVYIELMVGLVGGFSSSLLFLAFAAWMQSACTWHNSLVDRIVTAQTSDDPRLRGDWAFPEARGVIEVTGGGFVLFSLTGTRFLTPPNIANILVQSTMLMLLALPMTLIIMTEGLDLSMGAVLTLASIALAMTVVATGSPVLGFLAGLAVGLGFGLANGALVALIGIPPFIATLAMMVSALGIGRLTAGQDNARAAGRTAYGDIAPAIDVETGRQVVAAFGQQ